MTKRVVFLLGLMDRILDQLHEELAATVNRADCETIALHAKRRAEVCHGIEDTAIGMAELLGGGLSQTYEQELTIRIQEKHRGVS